MLTRQSSTSALKMSHEAVNSKQIIKLSQKVDESLNHYFKRKKLKAFNIITNIQQSQGITSNRSKK